MSESHASLSSANRDSLFCFNHLKYGHVVTPSGLVLFFLRALSRAAGLQSSFRSVPWPEIQSSAADLAYRGAGNEEVQRQALPNAAVVFNPSRDGKDLGNLEVKTDPDGKAVIDVIPTGSTVRVQVIATGFATFGQDYLVDGPTKEISIVMLRPQEQVSAYEDNSGRLSERKPGVQEPIRPKPATPAQDTSAPAAPKP